MAISQAKLDETASNRFFLVKITPGRDATSDLSLESGLYEMTFPFVPVSKITRNGDELTEVSGTPSTNDEWNFDESTKLLRIKLAAAPDTDDNVIIVFYDLFYTTQKTRYIAQDPESVVSASNPKREWKGRISRNPALTQTMRNITQGIFTVSRGSISLINADSDFQQYMTLKDSFNNKAVKIWVCIDSIDDIRSVNEGKISGKSSKGKQITLSIFDTFQNLQSKALFGTNPKHAQLDSTVEADDATFHFRVAEPFISRPWKILFGETSPHKMIKVQELVVNDGTNSPTVISDDTSTNPYEIMGQSPVNKAFIGNESSSNTGNYNVVTDRYLTSAPLLTPSVTGGLSVGLVGSSGHTLDTTCTSHNLTAGDFITLESSAIVGSARFRPGVVTKVVSSTVFRTVCFDEPYDATWRGGTITVGFTSFTPDVLWLDGGKYIPRYRLGTTISGQAGGTFTVPDSGGDFRYNIVGGTVFSTVGRIYDPSWETTTDDPKTFNRYYRLRFDTTGDPDIFSHAEILKRILQSANMTVNASSFTQADSDLSSDVRFTIPEFDQSNFGDYLQYAQRLLTSTFGNLAINDSLEIVYKLFDTPSPTVTTTEKKILRDSLQFTTDYTDIVTQLNTTNPYTSDDDSDTEVRITHNTGKYLHEVDNVREYRHYLTDMSTRAVDIMKALRNRSVTYSFSTATQLLDSDVGDEVTIESDDLEGGTQDLVITQVRRRGDKVDVKGTDLGDL